MMPSLGFRADGIRLYLTGAASNGAAQPDPALALGNYRSATEAGGRGGIVSANTLPLVAVDFVAGWNEAGATGGLRGDADGNLYWTGTDATEGAAVAILDGESKVLEGGTPYEFVRVTRAGADGIYGGLTLSIGDQFNNGQGMENVTNAERAAGATHYRALMLRCMAPFGLMDLKLWKESTGGAGLSYGVEVPTANQIQTIASATTAPAGITWLTSTAEGGGYNLAWMDKDDLLGIWLKRVVSAGATVSASVYQALNLSFVVP